MFSKDISQSHHRTPRTMNDAFGPYAKLSVPSKRRALREYFWMVAYGVAIGIGWYVLVAIKVGS